MTILDRRIKKLEKTTGIGATMYPNGKIKAKVVSEIPENPDPDTFYIQIVGVEPKKVIS